MTKLEQNDLTERLNLIESMIAEGRRTTESWGWTFVLWGVAYYVAIAWATLGKSIIAWPVTMVAASVLTGILASRNRSRGPETTIGRSMMAIWVGMGISTFILMLSLGMSGRLEMHVAVAIVGAMLGTANATSSIILKWKMQFACALVWWASAVVAAFGPDKMAEIFFLAAIFFCQIIFGIYGMICEAREHRGNGASHEASHA
jgi:hypothetical protein